MRLSRADQLRAARAHNTAIRHLAKSFEIKGLAPLLARNHASKVLADASFNVELTLKPLKVAGDGP